MQEEMTMMEACVEYDFPEAGNAGETLLYG